MHIIFLSVSFNLISCEHNRGHMRHTMRLTVVCTLCRLEELLTLALTQSSQEEGRKEGNKETRHILLKGQFLVKRKLSVSPKETEKMLPDLKGKSLVFCYL